ncbi:uncharacterized protein LOC106142089 [Amyelois transitella]|uniref:uncharacterized protein LOC106142089 n=1 Tax=Amyelois transitella TaxID=680683 RepID=UPI0029905C7C|nr:uncharacterized protein LOC106142089 [Amyelois transitella]
MSQNARPTYPQLEALVNFLEENPGIAKGHLRSAQAKWETKRKWEEITITLNAMGGTQKDAKGWTKFWTDKKYALKKVLGQRNADANRTGGGRSANLPPLTCIEERMVAILGGRGFAEGDSQFSVPILPSQDQPSTSQPLPASVTSTPLGQQEDSIVLPLPGTPAHSPPLASMQSTPRRSPRIRARLSCQAARTTGERGRRSQLQVERDRLVSIEEKWVEAELLQARALQENMAGLAAACNNIAEAISIFGERLVNVVETFMQSH